MNYDLRTLADMAELHDLLLHLGRALDEHRFDDLSTVLTQDATGTTRNGTGSGREVLIAQIEIGNKDHARLLHRFSSVLIEVDGDTATIRAYITALSGHADRSRAGLPALRAGPQQGRPDARRLADQRAERRAGVRDSAIALPSRTYRTLIAAGSGTSWRGSGDDGAD